MAYQHGGDIYTHKGLIDFSSNINPFGTSEKVIAAAKRGVEQMQVYPDSRCGLLREAFARRTGLPEDYFVFGNGAADLIFGLVAAYRPKKAVLTAPSFSEYGQALQTWNCEIVYHYLKEGEGFGLGRDFLGKLSEDVDMVFLCSPDNPTGQCIEPELLANIAEVCATKGILLVLDQCFCEFQADQSQVMRVQEVQSNPGIFLLRAFTKMYAMPGLRLGYGICSDKGLMERLEEVRQPWSVSVVAQTAGLAALDEKDWVEDTKAFITGERCRIEKALQSMGITFIPSKANYILLKSHLELFTLLKERGLLIRDCNNYVGLQTGWYRIAIKRREDNDVLLAALEELYRGRRGA